jgi:branched-chain amino acid transport system substrate-binding protein
MKSLLRTFALAGASAVMMSGIAAADTIKVGVLAPFGGPMAIWGEQFKNAINVYVAQHGNKAGAHTIEFIYKDAGFGNPDLAKSLAQELLVKDKVNYLAGFVFTPDALAVAPLINRSKTPTVIFNAGLSEIPAKSPYFVRVGFTLGQVAVPMAEWAWKQGIKKVVIAVSDFGPGIDGEKAFGEAFKAKGGEIADTIRMPLQTTDFAPFMQRIKDQRPNALFTFLPSGPPTYAFTKAYHENGLAAAGVRFLGTGETDETTLKALGDAAIGVNTSYIYSGAHKSEVNARFLAKLEELHPGSVANLASAEAYDGAHMIYEMVKAAGADPEKALAAAKTMRWESPRGPVSIDPNSRHLTQNVYIRVVEKDAGGKMINREIETFEAQPDHGWKGN